MQPHEPHLLQHFCKVSNPSEITSFLLKLSPAVKWQHIISGPDVIKLFSCSTQLSMKFVLLIKLKLLTILNSFLLNIAEHEKSFITSGPGLPIDLSLYHSLDKFSRQQSGYFSYFSQKTGSVICKLHEMSNPISCEKKIFKMLSAENFT